MCGRDNSHRLARQRVDDRLGIKVLLPLCILCKQFPRAVPEQLVVGDLELERARVPRVVQIDVVGVDERELFVCALSAVSHRNRVQSRHTDCLCCEDVLVMGCSQ